MKDTEIKRTLFEKFSNQLILLKEGKLLDFDLKYEKTYICPICLEQFSEKDLIVDESKNYLTIEDVPIKKLGGVKVALTCKKCNSSCGHNIDYHLKEFMDFEEFNNKTIGSNRRGTIVHSGNIINVEFFFEHNSDLKIKFDKKRNNPKNTEFLINSYESEKKIQIYPDKNRVDPMKLTFAFLKTNYILTFSKFGYIFILNKYYQKMRDQLLSTNLRIFIYNFAIQNFNFRIPIGTYYVFDKGIECIFHIFKLKTPNFEKVFATYMPLPINTIEEFIENMEKRKKNGNVNMNLTKFLESDNPLLNINILQNYI